MPNIIVYDNKALSSSIPLESLIDLGTFKIVENISQLNDIPQDKRKAGLIGIIPTDDGAEFYVLKNSPWTYLSSDWVELGISPKVNEIKYSDKEIPTGVLDGENCIFYLQYTPVEKSEHVFLNGVLQDVGLDSDYTILGNSIIFNNPPLGNFKIRCSYRYI